MHTRRQELESDLSRTSQDLQQAVDALSDRYFAAPIGELRNALETDIVRKEHARVEAAYRTRSAAMAVLWRVDRVHNALESKGTQKKCRCGLDADRCQVLQALEPFTAVLDRWEDEQKDRLREGLQHGLPPEHPDVIAERDAYRGWGRPVRRPGRTGA